MLQDEKISQVHTLSEIERISELANSFYKAKKVEGVSAFTLAFYKQQLRHFLKFCEGQVIDFVSQITANHIRDYLLWLEEGGHNPGGVHAAYRVLKTFLRWYDLEMEPEGWRNPISKVKAPKLTEEPLSPVEVETVKAMTRVCENDFLGKRDRAILLSLLDTGARAREFLSIDLVTMNLVTGEIVILQGKGRKSRSVFIGRNTRRAIKAYLKERDDKNPAAWVTSEGERLSYIGLRKIIIRRAKQAGVAIPTTHDFRRAFALECLRNGMDLVTLARLMGHTSIKVLMRYLKQLPEDLQAAHSAAGPVDKGKF